MDFSNCSKTPDSNIMETEAVSSCVNVDAMVCHDDGEDTCEKTSSESIDQGKVMSKRQKKKLIQQQRWQQNKAARNAELKERRKLKRQKKQEEAGEDACPSRKQLKLNTMKNSTCRVQVVIDCSFDDLMVERDIKKLGQQIQFCYSANRRSPQPVQLYLTSLGGKTLERLDRVGDHHGWDIHQRNHSYLDEFSKDSIVYLTSDSTNVLQTLDADKAYIIGGLVDHNHHKGLCHELACKNGITHARLPIGEFMQLSSRKVLTVNHVFEILLNFTQLNNWSEAFHRVIPLRKQAGQEDRHKRKLEKHDNGVNCESSNECPDEELSTESHDSLSNSSASVVNLSKHVGDVAAAASVVCEVVEEKLGNNSIESNQT